eukprot:CCRYP_018561-RE/>CCRYP_018561-RE protein AED:0.21 eAED:0.21 QI:2264/0.8/0.81/1/0.3/0.45/11/0/145
MGNVEKTANATVILGFMGYIASLRNFVTSLLLRILIHDFLDDDGEVYTLITDTENKALLSYTRPLYASRPLNVIEISQNTSSEMDINDENNTFATAENSTDYDVTQLKMKLRTIGPRMCSYGVLLFLFTLDPGGLALLSIHLTRS